MCEVVLGVSRGVKGRQGMSAYCQGCLRVSVGVSLCLLVSFDVWVFWVLRSAPAQGVPEGSVLVE